MTTHLRFRPVVREPRASFTYAISADNIIQIIDQDQGRSVTNDIANVLADIARSERLESLAHYRVIYRDTTGRWGGVALNEQGVFTNFYSIRVQDQAQALQHVR